MNTNYNDEYKYTNANNYIVPDDNLYIRRASGHYAVIRLYDFSHNPSVSA